MYACHVYSLSSMIHHPATGAAIARWWSVRQPVPYNFQIFQLVSQSASVSAEEELYVVVQTFNELYPATFSFCREKKEHSILFYAGQWK
jgi:hypothetical protein